MDLITIVKIVGLCLFAYLFGSIPFGYIIGWFKGVNLREVGSGKIGATNAGRALGWKYRILVGFLDGLKGAIPVAVTIYLFKSPWWVVGLVFLLYMVGAILSIWMKLSTGSFRAGAGVAALIGGLLVLAGWKVWLTIMGCWLIFLIFFVRRKMSAASLGLTGIILISIWAIPIFLYIYVLPALLISLGLVWWAHRDNLKRILKGEEPSIKLPSFLNKLPDDIVGWTIEKLKKLFKRH